jgi:hypothetical protein
MQAMMAEKINKEGMDIVILASPLLSQIFLVHLFIIHTMSIARQWCRD